MKSNLSFAMRLYRIDQILQAKGSATFNELLLDLKCSAPTLKRDLRYLREKVGARIVYLRDRKVYKYVKEEGAELKRRVLTTMMPTAWFTPKELFAVGAALQLFKVIEKEPAAVLSAEMDMLTARLVALMPKEFLNTTAADLFKRVKVILPTFGDVREPFFAIVGLALMRRKRLRLTYYTRTRATESAREVSPQRLVYWRGRWYLDAWCHETKRLKTFAIENIRFAELLATRCQSVPKREIEAALDSTYGIFSGGDTKTAVIEIDSLMAQYERTAVWHPDQTLTLHDDGTMTLEVPYASPTEITSEIMRLGKHARVVSPESLVEHVREQYCEALAQYDDPDGKDAP